MRFGAGESTSGRRQEMEPLGGQFPMSLGLRRLGEAFPHAVSAEDLKQESGLTDPEALDKREEKRKAAGMRPKIAKAACGGGFSVVLSSEGEARKR